MDDIILATDNLVRNIKDSEVYAGYQLKKKNLYDNYPDLAKRTDEFRRKNVMLQNKGIDIYEEADRLQSEYYDTLSNPVVRDFLDAENSLCRILQQINYKLLDELEFELGDMDTEENYERQ